MNIPKKGTKKLFVGIKKPFTIKGIQYTYKVNNMNIKAIFNIIARQKNKKTILFDFVYFVVAQ